MEPAHEIKIRDLLGDAPAHKYKATWLGKEAELDGIAEKKIAEAKKVFFGKMKLGISALEKPELADKAIKIYKNAAADEFDTTAQIKDLKVKKNPAVNPGKIEWAEEGSDKEMVFQVNFASQEYGGGTFRKGFVQEEIKNVLSTTSSILTANKTSLGLAPRDARDKEKPTPVVIVGQIKDFTGTDSLPYGWKEDQWKKSSDLMIKSSAPTAFNELAIAANNLGKSYGSDNEQSVKSLFNNALAGFKLAKEVADEEGKSCKIKTGLFGAGAFHNSPEFSIAMQYLAARIADVEIEFCGIALDKKPYIEAIFSRVDEMIGSKMSLDDVVTKELLGKWKGNVDDRSGWRTDKNIPPLKKKKTVSWKEDPENASLREKVDGGTPPPSLKLNADPVKETAGPIDSGAGLGGKIPITKKVESPITKKTSEGTGRVLVESEEVSDPKTTLESLPVPASVTLSTLPGKTTDSEKSPDKTSILKKDEYSIAKETPKGPSRTPVKSKDRWKISYPRFYKDENGKKGEAGKSWSSAKNNFFEGFFAILPLPFGRGAKDDEGNTLNWPLGLINKMLMATIDLALAVAWGAIEYVIPLVINTLTWPLRKMGNAIADEIKPQEILTTKEVVKKEVVKKKEEENSDARLPENDNEKNRVGPSSSPSSGSATRLLLSPGRSK